MLLSVGDTTFLDYDKILVKRDEYGPIGSGGNGLILHSSLAVHPDSGQPLGLLWEKLWKREPKRRPRQKGNAKAEEKTSGCRKKSKKKTTFSRERILPMGRGFRRSSSPFSRARANPITQNCSCF